MSITSFLDLCLDMAHLAFMFATVNIKLLIWNILKNKIWSPLSVLAEQVAMLFDT